MTEAATLIAYLMLALLGHGLLWMGLINRIHSWAGPHRLVDGLTFVCVAMVAVIPIAGYWRYHSDVEKTFDAALQGGPALYIAVCTGFAIATLISRPITERRRYDRTVLTDWRAERYENADLVESELLTLMAKLQARLPRSEALQISVDHKALRIARLPSRLSGMTICHLSDLHFTGGIGRGYFDRVVHHANEAAADLICVTGDLIENESCRDWLDEALGRLRAPLGVYFVLGNHDYYIDVDRTRESLVSVGWTYCNGRWLELEWRGALLRIGGTEAPWVRPTDQLNQAPDRRPDEFRIVLSHSPDQFGWCASKEADLVLAGHTHGGQVQLPWLGVIASPSLYGAKYACGVFRRRQTVMHVSRGISGENPWRWRCPPEVAILRLEAARRFP